MKQILKVAMCATLSGFYVHHSHVARWWLDGITNYDIRRSSKDNRRCCMDGFRSKKYDLYYWAPDLYKRVSVMSMTPPVDNLICANYYHSTYRDTPGVE